MATGNGSVKAVPSGFFVRETPILLMVGTRTDPSCPAPLVFVALREEVEAARNDPVPGRVRRLSLTPVGWLDSSAGWFTLPTMFSLSSVLEVAFQPPKPYPARDPNGLEAISAALVTEGTVATPVCWLSSVLNVVFQPFKKCSANDPNDLVAIRETGATEEPVLVKRAVYDDRVEFNEEIVTADEFAIAGAILVSFSVSFPSERV